MNEKLLSGFDPDHDVEDRRILYEVTGHRIYQDEFIDEDSSDSSLSDERMMQVNSGTHVGVDDSDPTVLLLN